MKRRVIAVGDSHLGMLAAAWRYPSRPLSREGLPQVLDFAPRNFCLNFDACLSGEDPDFRFEDRDPIRLSPTEENPERPTIWVCESAFANWIYSIFVGPYVDWRKPEKRRCIVPLYHHHEGTLSSRQGPISSSLAKEMIAEQVRIWIENTLTPLRLLASRILFVPAPPMTRSSASLRYGDEFGQSTLHRLWYDLCWEVSLPLIQATSKQVDITVLGHPEEALEPSAHWLREEFKSDVSEADRHPNERYGRLVLEQIRKLPAPSDEAEVGPWEIKSA